MDSDINTKKPNLNTPSSFDVLMDLYWGGSERRITGLTLRILLVNIIALLIFIFGLIQFSGYQTEILTTKLEAFRKESLTIAQTISRLESGLGNKEYIQNIMRDTKRITGHEIIIFDTLGNIQIQTASLDEPPQQTLSNNKKQSLAPFRFIVDIFAKILPQNQILPVYPSANNFKKFPDIMQALQGKESMRAWRDSIDEKATYLSTAAPIIKNNALIGAVYMVRSGADIRKDIQNFWIQILQIFLLNFFIMLLISIYLSGSIARPLRRLTRAAEQIRRNKNGAENIPDLSERLDEIGELSLVLIDMTESLQERLGTIERFAADVAHELKNPLTSMKSAAETLQNTKKKENREKMMAVLQHDIQRMDRLITDISAASRLDAALYNDVLSPLNINKILENMTRRYQDQFHPKIIFEYSAPASQKWIIRAAEDRVQQVIDNVVMNAVSFAQDADVITISLHKKNNMIDVYIEDQGPGIPEEKLEDIFNRFYSQRPQTESFGKHSGLGLSICNQIMTAMGGAIRAQNIKTRDGKIAGARFVISFVKAA